MNHETPFLLLRAMYSGCGNPEFATHNHWIVSEYLAKTEKTEMVIRIASVSTPRNDSLATLRNS